MKRVSSHENYSGHDSETTPHHIRVAANIGCI